MVVGYFVRIHFECKYSKVEIPMELKNLIIEFALILLESKIILLEEQHIFLDLLKQNLSDVEQKEFKLLYREQSSMNYVMIMHQLSLLLKIILVKYLVDIHQLVGDLKEII